MQRIIQVTITYVSKLQTQAYLHAKINYNMGVSGSLTNQTKQPGVSGSIVTESISAEAELLCVFITKIMLPQKTQISSDGAHRLSNITGRLKYRGWKHSNNFKEGERELRGANSQ